jgi:hypothetical protein
MGHHCGNPLRGATKGHGQRHPRAALGAGCQGQCALGFPLGAGG